MRTSIASLTSVIGSGLPRLALAAFMLRGLCGLAFAGPVTNLVITYDTLPFGYDQVGMALANGGQSVDTILEAGPGALAAALSTNDYTNVFLWDIGLTDQMNGADLSALSNWYVSHQNIVLDGRSYGAIFNGIAGDEGAYLNNVATVFGTEGGGLWIGADNASPGQDWQLNADAALVALSFNPLCCTISSSAFFVDNSNPIMAGITGSNLFWGWSAGEAPTGLQPNGINLCAIGWDNNGTPLISTNASCTGSQSPEPSSIETTGIGTVALMFFVRRMRSWARTPAKANGDAGTPGL